MDRFVLPTILAGCLILQYSFSQLSIPGGVPLGELVLLLYLVTTNIGVTLTEMGAVINLTPFLVWWIYSIGSASLGLPEYGLWALRDASQALDSLFLIVGFHFARTPENVERLFRWLPPMLVITVIYAAAAMTFEDELAALSPHVTAANGQSVAFLGPFGNYSDPLLWAAMYLIITAPGNTPSLRVVLLAGGIICYTILQIQARTTYLQIAAMLALMTVFRRKTIAPMLSFIPLVIVAVLIISTLGIRFSGRLTDEISLSFFVDHLASIFGISEKASAVAGAAKGVDQRLQWWTDIYQRVTADPVTFLTGLGYGFPLISYQMTGSIPVREPHNSIISIFARGGLIGFSAWVWMHTELFLCGVKCFYASRRFPLKRQWENHVLILLTFFVLILVGAVAEDRLEKTFNAIPYYFFWGVLMALSFWQSVIAPSEERERIDSPQSVAEPVVSTGIQQHQ